MSALASVALLVYAAVNAFEAWSIIRRRSGSAQGFMAAAAVLVIAAVAVAFSHWSKVPFALVGVVGSSWVSLADARAARANVPAWRHALRAGAGALVLWAAASAPTGSP